MHYEQDRPGPHVLASKPSSSFSSVSAAGSATSAATSRSGGSRLLFGEIDTSSDRSSESYASVCSFVLCDSSTFLKFWLEDRCRDSFLSCVPKSDLANLRLACHDFSVRAAPALFSDLRVTFKSNTFTRPARLAALDRVGFHVKTLHMRFPHTSDTFLPPLVDPETGAELSFTYNPQLEEMGTLRRPKYGDVKTTELLTRQYPPLFHAATNVSAFTRAFSAFANLSHLRVSCPGYDFSQRYRRSIVDYALISLRLAVEKNSLNALDSLTLNPIHPGGLIYLSPLLGFGASPKSASRWIRIRNLTIHALTLPSTNVDGEPHQLKLLQTYLRNFQKNLETFIFRWIGAKGPLPVQPPVLISVPSIAGHHPAFARPPPPARSASSRTGAPRALHFPKLKRFEIENVQAAAGDISIFVESHHRTLEELNLEDIELTNGSWDDALAPLIRRARAARHSPPECMDIPIMLSPTAATGSFPRAMERAELAHQDVAGRRSLRMSNWLGAKGKKPAAARRVREGWQGCEEQLRKMLRGGVFSWK